MKIRRLIAAAVACATVASGSVFTYAATPELKNDAQTVTNTAAEFTVPIKINQASSLNAFALGVSYDPTVLEVQATGATDPTGDKLYASLGSDLSTAVGTQSNVLVADYQQAYSKDTSRSAVLVGFATTNPVNVAANADIVDVKFKVKDTTAKETTINYVLIEYAESATSTSAGSTVTGGTIKLGASGLKGDVNFDDAVDILDANIVYNYVIGKASLSDQAFERADVNTDTAVDILDANIIYNFIIGNATIG